MRHETTEPVTIHRTGNECAGELRLPAGQRLKMSAFANMLGPDGKVDQGRIRGAFGQKAKLEVSGSRLMISGVELTKMDLLAETLAKAAKAHTSSRWPF